MISLPIAAQEFTIIENDGIEIDIPSLIALSLAEEDADTLSILATFYSSSGYFNPFITKVASKHYRIEKGCRFVLSKIISNEEQLAPGSEIEERFYTDQFLEDYIDELLTGLEQEGYLFSKIEIQSIQPNLDNCKVSVSLDVNKGKRWLTSDILFPGASLNNSDYLRKISGFRDSVLINQNVLEQLYVNLEQSELFEEISFPEVFLEEEKAVIVIAVQERVLNQFDGLLGYVPDQNGDGQIVGDFELSLWNVLNQGNGIDLEYQRLRPETTRLNIGVSQDWFGSIPVGLGFNFNLYQNDTTYQTRNLRLNGYYRISPGLRLTGELGRVSSTSSNSAPVVLEPDGKKQYGKLGFRYSTLNNADVPTQGVSLNIQFGIADKSVEIDSLKSFSQRFIESQASYFIPLSSKSVLAFSTEAFLLNTARATENDLIFFGGANSFRGYSEEQFRASRLFWGDIEYRFLVDRFSYLFTFISAGGYHRPKLLTEPDKTFRTSDFLYSTGFGISYKTRIGRLKFAYAISPEESLGNGKVHIGIVTEI
ncbi:MAG: BamA/TamA family outer membrane protein [Balneolaceae bacterium]|nr:BamA/TamA family outer membrane protein [Balneolaceae bacterium]